MCVFQTQFATIWPFKICKFSLRVFIFVSVYMGFIKHNFCLGVRVRRAFGTFSIINDLTLQKIMPDWLYLPNAFFVWRRGTWSLLQSFEYCLKIYVHKKKHRLLCIYNICECERYSMTHMSTTYMSTKISFLKLHFGL